MELIDAGCAVVGFSRRASPPAPTECHEARCADGAGEQLTGRNRRVVAHPGAHPPDSGYGRPARVALEPRGWDRPLPAS
jgi:hypothetical protein